MAPLVSRIQSRRQYEATTNRIQTISTSIDHRHEVKTQ